MDSNILSTERWLQTYKHKSCRAGIKVADKSYSGELLKAFRDDNVSKGVIIALSCSTWQWRRRLTKPFNDSDHTVLLNLSIEPDTNLTNLTPSSSQSTEAQI